MSEGPDNLVLTYLRRLDEKVDRLADDLRELKTRVGFVEQQLALFGGQLAGVSARIDRVESRLDRIERRLDLQDA